MTPKEQSEKLMNDILPFAEFMLKQHGEFFPYGGYLKPDGDIVHVGAQDPECEHPKSRDLIYVLQESFRQIAREGRCRAVAIVSSVMVPLPNSHRKTSAIQVYIDHVEGYSAEVFLPYEIVKNDLIYGEIFAQKGKDNIFSE